MTLIFVLTPFGSDTLAREMQSPTQSDQQSELNRAQKQNQEAQTEYYLEQTKKLRAGEPNKTFWQNVSDNPASALGVLGAVIVALVTLISFILNYRVSLNNQMDTQFYEALKRLGDKDSPAVRSSAAALIAQMSGHGRRNFRLRHPIASLKNGERAYFTTSRNQLVTGLLLEENSVALLSIRDALHTIVKTDPRQAAEMIFRANQWLMREAVVHVVQFCSWYGARSISEISDSQWEDVAAITLLDDRVLRYIINNNLRRAEDMFKGHALMYQAIPSQEHGEHRLQNQKDLGNTFFRLKLIVDIYGNAFANHDLSDFTRNYGPLFLAYANLKKANFQNADLSGSHLFRAGLEEANLTNATLYDAWMRGATLTGAKLSGSAINENTDFTGTNWWQANFYAQGGAEIDSALLNELFDRYRADVPKDRGHLHPSVQDFVADNAGRTNPSSDDVEPV